MDGQTALNYSRTRFDNSDLDRIRRQQQVIFAAIDKAVEQRVIGVDSLTGLWNKYKGAIDTDVNDIQTAGFASLAAQIDPTKISALSLGAATTAWTTPDGRAVLLYDPDIVQEIVLALFSDQQLAQEAARVEIQNATGADDLASLAARYLASFGFSSEALVAANAVSGTIQPQTEIIDLGGKSHTVERLASILEVPPERVRSATAADRALATDVEADVLVVLGSDVQGRDFVIEEPVLEDDSGS
jgi:hypothetical protein